jgi:hypothetical protein
MTGKRQRYLLVCLILLACGILIPAGNHLLRAASAVLSLPANLVAVRPPVSVPSFSLFSPRGAPMRSADLQGKVAVIRFWATW